MKGILKKNFLIIAIAIPVFFIVQLSSCTDNTDNNTNVSCTGCASSTPWAKPNSSTGKCYATQAECEAAEGSGCVLCD